MADRARSVLAWIDAIEERPYLVEHFDEIMADCRFAPGMVVFIAPQPPLPVDLRVMRLAGEDDAG